MVSYGAFLLALGAIGCGDEIVGQGVPLTNTCLREPPLDYDNTGDGLIGRHCRPCHSEFVREAQRAGAPEGIDFDDEQDVLDWAELIEDEAIIQQTMPPAGGMLQNERDALEEYLRCDVFPSLGRASVGPQENGQ
ncbi:MAG: hypothetical protein AAF211_12920 [Myxococcota bacterium]